MPVKGKSKLPARVSPSCSEHKKSGSDSDPEQGRWASRRTSRSRIPRAATFLREVENPSSSSENEPKNNNLQTKDSGISLKFDRQNDDGNFIKKTVRSVMKSVTPTRERKTDGTYASKVAPRETCPRTNAKSASPPVQNETSKPTKKLAVPRDTKASALRKQLQTERNPPLVKKKKRGKSASKAVNSVVDPKELNVKVLNDNDKTDPKQILSSDDQEGDNGKAQKKESSQGTSLDGASVEGRADKSCDVTAEKVKTSEKSSSKDDRITKSNTEVTGELHEDVNELDRKMEEASKEAVKEAASISEELRSYSDESFEDVSSSDEDRSPSPDRDTKKEDAKDDDTDGEESDEAPLEPGKKKVRFIKEPQVFIIPSRYDNDEEEEDFPVTGKKNLNPFLVSFEEGLRKTKDGIRTDTSVSYDSEDGALATVVYEAKTVWKPRWRRLLSGIKKSEKRLEVLVEEDETEESQDCQTVDEEVKATEMEEKPTPDPKSELSVTESETDCPVLNETIWSEVEAAVCSPSKGKRRQKAEAKALDTVIQELSKLHFKIADIRKAFCGKKIPDVGDHFVKSKSPNSQVTWLQNVKGIVSSIVQMSEEFKDGMQSVVQESSLHSGTLQIELTRMKEEYIQAIDEKHGKIKSLTEENESLRVQLKDASGDENPAKTIEDLRLQIMESEQEMDSLKCLIESTNAQNEQLWQRVENLEIELENADPEAASRQTDLVAKEEETPALKALRNEVQELQIQLQESDQHKQNIECGMQGLNMANEELLDRVQDLEEELKKTETEKKGLRCKLEEMGRELCRQRSHHVGAKTKWAKGDKEELDPAGTHASGENTFDMGSPTDEVNDLKAQLEEADQQRRTIDCLMDSVNTENEALRKELREMKEAIKNFQAERNDSRLDSLAMEHELKRRRREAGYKERELTSLKESLANREMQLEQIASVFEEQKTQFEEKFDSFMEALEKSQESNAQLEEQINQMKKDLTYKKGDTLNYAHLREEVELLEGSLALRERAACRERDLVVRQLRSCVEEKNGELDCLKTKIKKKEGELEQAKKSVQLKAKEMDAMKSKFSQDEKALQVEVETRKEREKKVNEENASLKARTQRLEKMHNRKNTDLQQLRGYVTSRDNELKSLKHALDDSNRTMANIQSMLTEKKTTVFGLKKMLLKKDRAANKMSGNVKQKLDQKRKLQSELDDAKKENAKLSAKIAQMEKNFEELEEKLREKDEDAKMKINNVLDYVKLQRNEIRELKEQLKGARNAVQRGQDVPKKQNDATLKKFQDTKSASAVESGT